MLPCHKCGVLISTYEARAAAAIATAIRNPLSALRRPLFAILTAVRTAL